MDNKKTIFEILKNIFCFKNLTDSQIKKLQKVAQKNLF